MAPFDFIAEQNVRDARLAFAQRLVSAKEDIVAFVNKRLGWNGTGYYDGFLKGSFNVSLVVRRADSDGSAISLAMTKTSLGTSSLYDIVSHGSSLYMVLSTKLGHFRFSVTI
ncbi:phosphotransferase enzyme family protein [Colletotrichum graminicola]|nr:phosphotransferase enzyme family protein [Colletotrichum graminicola]